ncbi:peptidoglycan DD-metalloendopeptidase family protein [Crocinitomix catalasitica]|nr:peptidoglycan DD-metalloendopeptidase family protein [Crocinitomix catalasitica]
MVCLAASAQEKESDRLKQQQKDLEKKINYTQTLLKNTALSRENLSDNIGLIDRKIEYRKDLLDNLDIQIIQLHNDIKELALSVAKLEVEVEKQKEQFKAMLRQAYKMRNQKANLIFILSSESFNQANRRMDYMEQLSKYRADQIRKIQASIDQLNKEKLALEEKRSEVDLLAKNKTLEQKRYINDRENQKKNIDDLKGKETQLQNELSQQKKKSREIQAAINAAINKEILAARKKEKETPRTLEETKEIELSNKGFEDNKGRLPWPVKKGEITKGYGKQPHPMHVNVYTYNNGVDITTVKGSTVRAVYSGEVSTVLVIPGAGKAIIIAHGNYRTIYSNLQETYVAQGDKVSAKQEIGALLVNGSGNSEVHFEIRKITDAGGISNINPTYWLYR